MQAPDVEVIRCAVEGNVTPTNCLIAEHESNVVGFASYALLFPGEGLAPQLYMKDLYTSAAHRSRGVARALIEGLAREAKKTGCVRIDWTTEADNVAAQSAYKTLGAKILAEKLYFRLDANDIERLARDDARAPG